VSELPTVVYLVAIGLTGPALATLHALAHRHLGSTDGGERATVVTLALAASTTVGMLLGPITKELSLMPVDAGAGIGATFGAVLAWCLVAHALPGLVGLTRRDRMVARLRRSVSRRATLMVLHRKLRRAEAGRNHDQYARALVHTVDVLSRAGFHEEVLEHLDRARFDRINSRGARYLAVYGALAHLHLGQMDEARNVLDGIEGSLDGVWEEWRLAIDAVAAAAVGRRREAKALASWIVDERYALERAVAQAHAFAAEGRRADAQRTLLRVQVEHDDPALESLYLVPGPATPLATAVLTGKGSPFR